MLHNLIYFLIAISLSMDAFSISLSLGTLNPNKKTIIKISICVGVFHLLMPIIGNIIGEIIGSRINLNANYITSLIFALLAIEMFFDKDSDDKIKILNTITILIISFSVSIDSFSVGLAISLLNYSIITSSIIFSLTSALFTVVGLELGKKIKKKYTKAANYIGIIILLLLIIKYLFL